MSNPSNLYGFRFVGLIDGTPPNNGLYRRANIDPTAARACFYGDVLLPLSGGYFAPFTAEVGGGAPVGGVAGNLFEWTSLTARMNIWNDFWTGNASDVPSGGTVGIGAIVNPQAVFQVRSAGTSAGPVTQAQVGSNANFTYAAGNTASGISGFGLDDLSIGSGASLPFKIYGIVQAPESDPASIYNEVLVIFNNLTNP